MIDLDVVGAHVWQDPGGRWQVRFGIYLPGITYNKGYRVKVRAIHERDQFVHGIEPKDFDLFWHNGSALDLWDNAIDLAAHAGAAGHFGQPGKYLYRYQLLRDDRVVTLWFSDPFGREAGIGTLSAFRIDPGAAAFAWTDGAFTVPEVDEMVVYELHVGEFNGDFDGVIAQLDHLSGLGVNVLELMPVSTVKEEVEWGVHAARLLRARRSLWRARRHAAPRRCGACQRHRRDRRCRLRPRPPRIFL